MEFFKVVCDYCSSELMLKVRSRLGTEVPCPRCGEKFVAREVIDQEELSDPEAEPVYETEAEAEAEYQDDSGDEDVADSGYDDAEEEISDDEYQEQYADAFGEILNAAGGDQTQGDPEEEYIAEAAEADGQEEFEEEEYVEPQPVEAESPAEIAVNIVVDAPGNDSVDDESDEDESPGGGESEVEPQAVENRTTVGRAVAWSRSRIAACRRGVVRASMVVARYCRTRQFRAGLVSLSLHTVLLSLLALFVIPNTLSDLADYVIESSIDDSNRDESLLSAKQEALAMEIGKAEPSLMAATMVGAVVDAPLDPLESIAPPEMAMSSSNKGPTPPNQKKTTEKKPKPVTRLMPAISKRGTAVRGPLLMEPEKGVKQSDTPQAAADGLFTHLKSAAGDKGPVWIIWLMDASLSLVAEREALAPQVQSFYQDLLASNEEDKRLINTAVLAFGATVQPVTTNSRSPDAIAKAIRNLPIDQTGLENVMSGVTFALNSLARFKGRIEIVVWTDESGDDLNYLEDVIALCRMKRAKVHVIGPLSVFGMEPGLQRFEMDKPHFYRVLLPVKRGPDSSFPERARLPLWYGSTDRPWSEGKLISEDGEFANLGGPLRHRLLAGTGPYGLTRLALATGGTFTALKRPGDLAPPDRERFLQYLPDYRSALEIASDIEKHPLRRAIIEAAALTWQINYWPPRRTFPITNDKEFPFGSYSYYVTPVTFQTMLERELRLDHEKLMVSQAVIEQAIEIMTSVERTGDAVQEEKESLRWRAWHDLNLGRLLAHSVRIREYLNLAERLIQNDIRSEFFKRGINHLQIGEAADLSTGRVGVQRAQEAKSRLERVIHEHPDTPWSQLAKWELEHELGFQYKATIIPPPPPPRPFVPRPSLPAPQIPRL